MMFDIVSLAVGRPQSYGVAGAEDPLDQPWESAIDKSPCPAGPVPVGAEGLQGDAQADRRVHGGPDKAICLYPSEHYQHWREVLAEARLHGFGENFASAGALEKDVCIGDVFGCGQLVVQLSQPRQPCWKLTRRFRQQKMALWAIESGRTGWYLRVLQPGPVSVGDRFELIDRPHPDWTVARANQAMHGRGPQPEEWESLRQLPTLAQSWKENLSRKLEGLTR